MGFFKKINIKKYVNFLCIKAPPPWRGLGWAIYKVRIGLLVCKKSDIVI